MATQGERGLVFCQWKVPKVLDASASVTRRLGGLKQYNRNPNRWHIEAHPGGGFWATNGDPDEMRDQLRDDCGFKCPYGVPGDSFYVKETWGLLDPFYQPFNDSAVVYKAWQKHGDNPLIPVYKVDHLTGNDGPEKIRWRSGRFQPKWTCRPQRWELVSVRPERLQDITAEDVVAEGIPFGEFCPGVVSPRLSEEKLRKLIDKLGQHVFAPLWDSINAKCSYAWDNNPWVWRIQWNPEPVVGATP